MKLLGLSFSFYFWCKLWYVIWIIAQFVITSGETLLVLKSPQRNKFIKRLKVIFIPLDTFKISVTECSSSFLGLLYYTTGMLCYVTGILNDVTGMLYYVTKYWILWLECYIMWLEYWIMWLECWIMWLECWIIWLECCIMWLECCIMWKGPPSSDPAAT